MFKVGDCVNHIHGPNDGVVVSILDSIGEPYSGFQQRYYTVKWTTGNMFTNSRTITSQTSSHSERYLVLDKERMRENKLKTLLEQ